MPIGQKKKALLHIAKEDLHLDEEAYRNILRGVAGVESSIKLTREGFDNVMKRFEELGFRGLLPDLYHSIPKGQPILGGVESITPNQKDFVSYLLEKLQWDDKHYRAFCQRIIKKPEPLTKREGQKIIIGLMAILRKMAIDRKKRRNL